MDGFVNELMNKAHKHPSVQQEFTFWENVQGFYHAVGACRAAVLVLRTTPTDTGTNRQLPRTRRGTIRMQARLTPLCAHLVVPPPFRC